MKSLFLANSTWFSNVYPEWNVNRVGNFAFMCTYLTSSFLYWGISLTSALSFNYLGTNIFTSFSNSYILKPAQSWIKNDSDVEMSTKNLCQSKYFVIFTYLCDQIFWNISAVCLSASANPRWFYPYMCLKVDCWKCFEFYTKKYYIILSLKLETRVPRFWD